MCACPTVISSISGKSFHFPFLYIMFLVFLFTYFYLKFNVKCLQCFAHLIDTAGFCDFQCHWYSETHCMWSVWSIGEWWLWSSSQSSMYNNDINILCSPSFPIGSLLFSLDPILIVSHILRYLILSLNLWFSYLGTFLSTWSVSSILDFFQLTKAFMGSKHLNILFDSFFLLCYCVSGGLFDISFYGKGLPFCNSFIYNFACNRISITADGERNVPWK